jgi:hypothetical protein
LLAIERDQTLDVFGEGGTDIDAAFVPSLVVSLFFPKTPLHDGGVIVRWGSGAIRGVHFSDDSTRAISIARSACASRSNRPERRIGRGRDRGQRGNRRGFRLSSWRDRKKL